MKKIILIAALFVFSAAVNTFATVTVNYVGGSQVGNINSYVNDYTAGAGTFLKNTADGLAISNTVFPVFGDPHRSFVIGINGAVTWILPDDKKIGKESLKETDYIASGAPFITLGLSENTDLTFKFMPSVSIKKGSDTMKVFNVGGVFRHRLLSKTRLIPGIFSFEGLAWSLGGFYSKNTFERTENPGVNEDVNVDGTVFTVTLNKVVHKVDTKNLSFDFELKPYFNFLEFLDIFFGAGVAYNAVSEATADSQIYANIVSGGNNFSGGYFQISGKENGKKVIIRYMAGIQLNIGPIKVPVEFVYSKLDSGKAFSASGGIAISF